MRRWNGVVAGVLVLASASAGAQQQSGSPIRPRTLAEDLQLFSQVMNQIRVNHADSLDMHALLMAAVEGMVQAADPHSYVIPAVRLDSARRSLWMAGKLYPVLVDFHLIDGAPLVSAVRPGTRVSQLDVLVGDELIEVEGTPVLARSPEELAYLLAGPKGTSVHVRFERRREDGSIVQLDRDLPRERAEDYSAIGDVVMLDSITGYIRITTFENDKVADDVGKGIEQLEKAGMRRLVLDLRDNGGGRVDQAADVAGAFLPRGTVVYRIASRKREMVDTGRVKRAFWRDERHFPLVVMINAGTASASELVAAALQDHDRALLVGHTSFGKSLVMVPVLLSDGSLMVLTVGEVFTPCGRVVQREYRGVSRRHYLRTAGEAADTAGRPSCHTDGGRVVYGGGGVVPDVQFPQRFRPAWLTRLGESDALTTWSSGYASAHAELGTLEDFARSHALPAGATDDFRHFASERGISVPIDSASERLLQTTLRRAIAWVKWNSAGLYRVTTLTDPDIARAVESFPLAEALPKSR